jgi:DNA-binding response OmpR family regulator/chromosome segregation ATPase
VKKILVLESDGLVIDALANEFAVFGCMVDAVDDAEMARQKASSDRFDLVIISTTLAKSHGFLAFTFLKRLPELENIPFVIMYNEGEADQIVSHQNRPTHAEVYLQKPFDFNDLLVQVMGYLEIEDQVRALVEGEPHDDTEEIEIDDAVVIDDEDVDSLGHISEEEMAALETPTDEEALVSGGDAATVVEPPPSEEPEPEPPAAPVEERVSDIEPLAVEDTEVEEEPRPAPPPPPPAAPAVDEAALEEAQERISRLEAEADVLRSQVEEAEIRVQDAEKDKREAVQEVDTLKAKIDDLNKALEEKGQASVSTRELLDLRELINRKDKEILNLKDDLNSKEKGLLEERDKTMQAQRTGADLEEKLLAVEREKSGLEQQLEATTKDLETASKRANDFKAHWDAAKQEIEATKVRMQENEDALRAEAQKAVEDALVEQQAQLADEKNSEIGSLKANHERALEEQKEQYEAEIGDIREKFEGDLKDLEERKVLEAEQALAAQQEEYETKLGEANQEIKDKEQVNKALMRESSSQERKIEELQGRIGELEAGAEEMKGSYADLTALKEQLSAELTSLRAHDEALRNELETQGQALAGAQAHIQKTDETLSAVTETLRNVTTMLEERERYSPG